MSQPVNRQRPPVQRGRPNQPVHSPPSQQPSDAINQPCNQFNVRSTRPSYAPRPAAVRTGASNNQSTSQPGLRIYNPTAHQPNNQSSNQPNIRTNNRSNNQSFSRPSQSPERYDTSIEMPNTDNQSFRYRRQSASNAQSVSQSNRQPINHSKREIKLTNNQSMRFGRFVTLFFVISFVMVAGFGFYTVRMKSLKASPALDQSLDPSVNLRPSIVPLADVVEEPLPSIHDQSINPEYIPPQIHVPPQAQPDNTDKSIKQDQPMVPRQSNNQQGHNNTADAPHQAAPSEQPVKTNQSPDNAQSNNQPVKSGPADDLVKPKKSEQSIKQPDQSKPSKSGDESKQSPNIIPPVPGVPQPILPYSNTAPVPLMTESVFPHGSLGHPLFSPPSSIQYSSFYCVGGRGRFDSQNDRACRFQNLCYKKSGKQWLFYQDPALKGKVPIMLDHGQVVTEFPPEFLNLRALGGSVMWSPKQVYEAIPTSAIVPRKHQERPDVYMFYHPRDASNIGFVLGDDFFPLFNLATTFGMLTNDAQLLMTSDCDALFAAKDESKAARCKHLLSTLSPGMTNRPILATSQSDLAEKVGMDAASDVMCFENVLTGLGPWGFQQSLGKAPTWWQYHHFYLSNMGLAPNRTPKKPRITVSIKEGDRAIYNNDAMVAHLKKAFPNYEIDAVELYKLGGWQQELAYLRDTSVLITPCGAVSMSGMFLPHGSALIVVDYWNTNKNNTSGMEEKMWSSLGYLRAYHYPFVESEVVLDQPGKDRNIYQHMRDYGRVNVDLKRMEMLVRDAIRHVDSFMIMGKQ